MTDRPPLHPRPALDRTADDQRMREALARYACCGAPSICGATCQDDEPSALLAWAHRQLANMDAQRDQWVAEAAPGLVADALVRMVAEGIFGPQAADAVLAYAATVRRHGA